MIEQENANEVVDIDRGDISNFTYYNWLPQMFL
jgi:hypothetical protein